jgi:hypothetical protein
MRFCEGLNARTDVNWIWQSLDEAGTSWRKCEDFKCSTLAGMALVVFLSTFGHCRAPTKRGSKKRNRDGADGSGLLDCDVRILHRLLWCPHVVSLAASGPQCVRPAACWCVDVAS